MRKLLLFLIFPIISIAQVGPIFPGPGQPASAGGTGANGFTWKRSITFDHTQSGATDSTNIPLVVAATLADVKTSANGGTIQNTATCCAASISVPADLVFTSDSGCTTNLSWDFESYTATTGAFIAWVKIPTLSHTVDTVIWMCYDKSSVTTYQATASATWNANYAVVYHWPNGSSLSLADSTANAFTLSNTATTATTGQMDGGAGFSSAELSHADNAALRLTSFTLSFWLKTSQTGNTVVAEKDPAGVGWSLQTCTNCTPANGLQLNVGTAGSRLSINTTHYNPDGAWHYFAFVYIGSFNGHVYIDGVEHTDTNAPGTPSYSTAVLDIGSRTGSFSTTMTMDEFHYSSATVSVDWVLAEFNNQKASSTMITIGTAQ